MIVLYLNNFRGFSNTYVPLVDVNFLVGENSTGKSSVLGLIHLLCSPTFWVSQNFNHQEYEFGSYYDILSAGCARTEKFSFGLSRTIDNLGEKKDYTYLVSYREKDALPKVVEFARLEGGIYHVFKQYKNEYRYLSGQLSADDTPTDTAGRFAKLVELSSKSAEKFDSLPDKVLSSTGPLALWSMLMSITVNQKKDEGVLLLSLPTLGHVAWLAPIRTKPKRTYDGYGQLFSPEGEHTPYLIRKKLKEEKGAQHFEKALSDFGKESGLFSKIMIHNLGDDATSPFEILIHLRNDSAFRINSVGYGVSQVLPLIVEMLSRRKNAWFALQQPEVHLHPRAQAALGDVIYSMAENENKQFLIETHSDFTIDRFRMNYRKNMKHKPSAQVLYFQRTDSGNRIQSIPIEKNGEYSTEQPDSFRQFFLTEQIDLLGL